MLYLVATPIGNLGDITLRALETLRSVDLHRQRRYAHDRRAAQALRHPQAADRLSRAQRAARRRAHRRAAASGASVALVTDAGTPGISDPGYSLVRRALDADLPVTMIPGAAGLIMAVVLSGLPLHSFTFRGFPPRKRGQRQRFLEHRPALAAHADLLRKPFRLAAFLEDALAIYGDRPAALANDLTKLYEHVERAPLSSLLSFVRQQGKLKGEYIVVIAGAGSAPVINDDVEDEEDI
jgi:16S rRNA (cytidine1402-2'-O)-methyltransferase